MAIASIAKSDQDAPVARGRGMAYVHYKHDETYVAMGMEVAVERASGKIKVERVACAFTPFPGETAHSVAVLANRPGVIGTLCSAHGHPHAHLHDARQIGADRAAWVIIAAR